MLVIHGVTRSRASRLVWLCHELDLPFRQEPVVQAYRLANPSAPAAPINTESPAFRALAPAGSIPVIEDDGLVLSESLACTLHLARKHGGPLAPRDASEDALMQQWSLYAATAIEPDALTIQMLSARPDPGDAALIAEAEKRLRRPFGVVQEHIRRQGFLVGGRFTVADLNMAECLRYAQSATALMNSFPDLRDWLTACQSRPAFQAMWVARLAEPETP